MTIIRNPAPIHCKRRTWKSCARLSGPVKGLVLRNLFLKFLSGAPMNASRNTEGEAKVDGYSTIGINFFPKHGAQKHHAARQG